MARGKGKRGGGRGTGKRFAAQSADEIEERNRRLAVFDEQRAKHRAETADDDKNDKDSPDGDGNDDDNGNNAEREAMLVGMRVARMTMNGGGANGSDEEDDRYAKKERKNKGLEGIIEVDNPNKVRGSGMLKIKDLGAPEPMTRKQREEAEKAAKAAAYRKRHELGLTQEYKHDMAKLNEVKKRRAVSEAKVKAQKEIEDNLEEERKKMALKAGAGIEEDDVDDKKSSSKSKKNKSKGDDIDLDDIDKLDKIAIKKMKPAQLKEALKDRGLNIQGNAKALTERLLQFEKAR